MEVSLKETSADFGFVLCGFGGNGGMQINLRKKSGIFVKSRKKLNDIFGAGAMFKERHRQIGALRIGVEI